MYRPPRKSQGAAADRRLQGQQDAQNAARELLNNQDVQRYWAKGDEKSLLAICKKKEWDVGSPAYTTAAMIFSALKGLLRSSEK